MILFLIYFAVLIAIILNKIIHCVFTKLYNKLKIIPTTINILLKCIIPLS